MLSKNITKIVQNLEKKKFRDKYNLFKIEGEKMVSELLLSSFKISVIYAGEKWLEQHESSLEGIRTECVTDSEMKSISSFSSLPEVMALAEIPAPVPTARIAVEKELILALNGIQDPGNLGTIFRVADWFGIKHIVCDKDCASIYNSKAVQASMGAIFRTEVSYTDIAGWLSEVSGRTGIFGTFLDGQNIYRTSLPPHGIIVMGNEGHGISSPIEKLVSCKLTIPSFSKGDFHSESLNVGVATGIILSEFKRCQSLE